MERFNSWWESISEREQRLVSVSIFFILVAVIYWGMWQPLSANLETSENQLQRAQEVLSTTQERATVLVRAGAGGEKAVSQKQNLTQIVNVTARQNDIVFSRIVNRNEQVEVLINNVEFNLFITWLSVLSEKYSVSVINADISKTDAQGYIKVNRLFLSY
ncbi:type II secretion system protein M [Psychromonas sp.]|uniref:type II secretion system protein M n=1 Tax=Psychromonas sp. TaxID=1884585 RepID=UPI00356A3F39